MTALGVVGGAQNVEGGSRFARDPVIAVYG
jgi:hypothetical protein